jgi:hypothetical protein
VCPPIDPIGPLGSEAREHRVEPIVPIARRREREDEHETEEEAQQRRKKAYEQLARERAELESSAYDDHGRVEHADPSEFFGPHIDLSA